MQYARNGRCYTKFRNTGRVPEKQEEDNMAFGKKVRPTVDKDGAALVMRKRDYLADFSTPIKSGLQSAPWVWSWPSPRSWMR